MIFNVFESFNIIYAPNCYSSYFISNTAFFYLLQNLLIISLILFVSVTLMGYRIFLESIVAKIWSSFYTFVYGIVFQQLNTMRTDLIPHVFIFALFILFGNLCGLVPYGFSLTSFPGVTLVLSAIVFFSCLILAFLIPIYSIITYKDLNKLRYLFILSFFAPHDVPIWLYPLIIMIEVISFFFRLVSLGFRLAANLMAGHILLGLLAAAYCGLIVGLGGSFPTFVLLSVIVSILILFETFVAFLQTYVFVVLLCSYYNDIYSHFDALA